MDLALRTLREGRAEAGGPAPLLLLRHSLAAAGGTALLRHALSELAAAVAGGRAQAAALVVVALERPAAAYLQQLRALPTLSLAVLDGFTDAHGWGSLLGPADRDSGSGSAAPAPTVVPLPGLLAAAGSVQRLQAAVATALAGLAQPAAVVFDSLSPLVDAAGAPAVAQLLHALTADPAASCLLAGLHADLHAAHEVGALEAPAAGTLAAAPAGDLERRLCAAAAGGAAPQGRLTARLRRRSGRVRCEVWLYRVSASGALTFVEPPAAAAAAAPAAAAAAADSAAAASAAPLAAQLAGGMKLGLSAEEEEARRRVQLPFEHQGQRDAYQAGDWRDYLPPEAGGRGLPGHGTSVAAAAAGGRQQQRQQAAAGPAAAAPAAAAVQQLPQQQAQQAQAAAAALGRILYVRDSGSEADSDEDPDDDLDI